MNKHELDNSGTYFCIKCGNSMRNIVAKKINECPATDNVIGISHILSRKKLEKVFGPVIEKFLI